MNNIKEFSIDYKDINISINDIGRIIGYSENEIPEHIQKEIESILIEVSNHCNLKGGYRIIENIEFGKESIKINDLTFNTQKIIAGFLRKGDSIAVMVCTVGKEMSDWLARLFIENDSLKAYIVDIVASLLADKTADIVQNTIEKEAESQFKKISNRYSPGYCSWDIKEQHKLFSLLPDNFCGIKLNKEALMIPTKSISAILSIGQDIEKKDYICDMCNQKECQFKVNNFQ